jgi:hypothetical protein
MTVVCSTMPRAGQAGVSGRLAAPAVQGQHVDTNHGGQADGGWSDEKWKSVTVASCGCLVSGAGSSKPHFASGPGPLCGMRAWALAVDSVPMGSQAQRCVAARVCLLAPRPGSWQLEFFL